MPKVEAPFTQEQADALNKYQKSGQFHPFTCIGRPYLPSGKQVRLERSREVCPNDGLLIATKDGWVCPCGDCVQDWCWDFMVK